MKKFSFILLFSILTVFLLSGCSDDSDDNKFNIEDYAGTYDVKFFATKPVATDDTYQMFVASGNMSTDCNKADELGILKKVDDKVNIHGGECSADGSNDAKIVGQQAVISYDEKTGLTLETKLQIWAEAFTFSPDDAYQYTKYTSVPSANVTSNTINEDKSALGVSGRNLTTKTSNPKSTFKVTKMSDGNLYVELELTEKKVLNGMIEVKAPTYVILEKKSEIVDPINPNTLFKTESGIEAADKVYAKFETEPKEPAETEPAE